MRFRSVSFPIMLFYEIARLGILLKQGAASFAGSLPISWYAAAGTLVLAPVIIFLIIADEERFIGWLPLLCLIKAAAVPSFAVYLYRTAPEAVMLVSAGDIALAGTLLAAVLCIAGDAFVFIFCLGRHRRVCK
ncbi:MAG: hypothetical protein JXP39_00455 [Spirochaetales bacterium]|nr:hypothetical protein [Spirochaetales bacterium]